MDWVLALAMLIGVLLVLMLIGLPVAFAFLAVNAVGAYVFLGGDIGFGQLARNAVQSMLNYSLAPIPLFILMGEMMLQFGLAFRAVNAIDRLIVRVPGRMPIVSVAAGTAFAALSGSSMANTAMLGNTLLPEMLKRGYHPSLAMGPIMGVGGLAILIPPSALAVLLGSLSQISISALLMAGIMPALIMASLYSIFIVGWAVLNPSLVPPNDVQELSGRERYMPFVKDVLPLFGIFVAVVGSLLGGFATPTESAAVGVVATMVAAFAYRRFSFASFARAILATGKVSGMILFIIVASLTFSQVLAFSGSASGLLRAIQAMDLTAFGIVLAIVLVLLFLGCFIDQVSMMMITLPFFIPLAQAAQLDLLWVGIIYLLALEIALITPPFGLLLFIMKGVAPPEITLKMVVYSAMPFLLIQLLVLFMVVMFPQIGTWLPNALFN